MPAHLLQCPALFTDGVQMARNVRQMKNVTEQLSIIEQKKEISAEVLLKMPQENFASVPLYSNNHKGGDLNGVSCCIKFCLK